MVNRFGRDEMIEEAMIAFQLNMQLNDEVAAASRESKL
jgi:hypothetical protein